MSTTAASVGSIVEVEIAKITQPELASRVRELLAPIRCEYREWDYGKPDEKHPCWIFAEHPESNTAFAFTEHGFGPSDPWGLLRISGEDLSMGMDSGWFHSLEDQFRASRAWNGSNPPKYSVG
jgi:hypothetical protein